MRISRDDGIGAACALTALALVSWLSVENQAYDACRTLLAAPNADGVKPSAEAEKCQRKLGLPAD